MTTGLIVPVMKNFKGLAKLFNSIDTPINPIIINNWDDNSGVGPAWNEGIRIAKDRGCENMVIVNDDVILTSRIIPLMTSQLNSTYVLVSPQNETGVCHPGGLNFWCYAISADFTDRFGYFDENFAPAYYEDDDMAYRIRLGGGRIKTLNRFVFHQVQGTQDYDPEPVVDRSIWDRNLDYFSKKWGGHPGKETFTTPFNDPTKTIKDW